jgi:hypothetical protein
VRPAYFLEMCIEQAHCDGNPHSEGIPCDASCGASPPTISEM